MRPTRGPGGVTRPAQSAGRCWEALLKGRDRWLRVLEESREGSGGHYGKPGEFKRAGRGWESLPEGWEGSGGPSKEPGVVKRPSRRAKRGQEGRKRMVGPPRGLVGVGKPSWWSRSFSSPLE